MAPSHKHVVLTSAAALVSALGITMLPTAAHAAPAASPSSAASSADLVTQVQSMQEKLSTVSEQYNDAKIKLADQNKASTAAAAKYNAAQQDVAAAKTALGKVAASAYTGSNSTAVSTLMTSSSPGDLIDKLGTLDQISSYNNVKVNTYLSASKSAAADKSAADAATAAATATETDLSSKKSYLESQLPKLKVQLAALTPAQNTAVQAVTGGNPAPANPAPSNPGTAPSAPAVTVGGGGSGTAQQAVSVAMAQIGKPYVFGAAGPNAFDCSGLTMYAYAAVGISLPHSSDAQSGMGTSVSMSALQPGDLLFASGHVAMYIGNGTVVHAPVPGANVRTMPMQYMSWFGAKRLA